MSIYNNMKAELKELVQLVRLDERYTAIVAHGTLTPDPQSKLSCQMRILRISELSRKYEIQ
jgi:hypothetical protein